MDKRIRKLPDAEFLVMQAVWACQAPASRAEIEKRISHPMALTTLLTQLTRLADKGFLTVQREGRSNCYTPTVTQQEYLAAQSRRFVDLLCGGSVSVFASALCSSGLSKEELAELRHLLEEGDL